MHLLYWKMVRSKDIWRMYFCTYLESAVSRFTNGKKSSVPHKYRTPNGKHVFALLHERKQRSALNKLQHSYIYSLARYGWEAGKKTGYPSALTFEKLLKCPAFTTCSNRCTVICVPLNHNAVHSEAFPNSLPYRKYYGS